MLYDRDLGWRLAANWKGRHRHYDFDAGYTTNAYGFRGEFRSRSLEPGPGRRYAVVGDSFTFGFGVEDHETFTAILGSRFSPQNVFLNFGVSGYSTDQEYLLIKKQVFHFAPDHILLIVYLANDLFDNALPFPLQANRPKPFFRLSAGQLILENTPVPLTAKSGDAMKIDLRSIVFGPNSIPEGRIARIVNRFELFTMIKPLIFNQKIQNKGFEERFAHYIELFQSIIQELNAICLKKNIGLSVALIPGRSFVERPNSPSAQFQDFLRKKIVQDDEIVNIGLIDLAHNLREKYRNLPGDWYFPNEGHLTPKGHYLVAKMLSDHLPKLSN